MRSSFLYLILLFYCCTVSIFPQSGYFIKYKNEVTKSKINSYISEHKLTGSSSGSLQKASPPEITPLTSVDNEILSRIYKVRFNNELSQSEIQQISSSPEVEYFRKAVIYKVDFIPDDKLIKDQWALQKINAFKAWDITTGSDTVIVGVIDTGIDYLHPDLQTNIYINTSEDINKNGLADPEDNNGIDDDGNGYIDDVMGWDFTDRLGFPFDSSGGDYLSWDNKPMDEYGHGTYVAGIIAAQANNSEGIAGIAPGVKILNLRAFDPGGYGEEDDVAAAVLYAVHSGVKVLNMSFGDNSFSYVLRDVLRYAYEKGVVLVGSSGNSSSDQPHYPSAFPEVISVGASTPEDYISSFSNFGSTLDIVAPGSEVLTTSLNSSYSTISGTSAAAPFISGAAALLLSRHNFNPAELKQILKSTSDDINSPGWDLKSGAGRLNLERALRIAGPAEIKFITPLQDFATNEGSVEITATILSPYFEKYDLQVGTGFNPLEWNVLTTGSYQFEKTKIYDLDVRNFKDSVYTLRLVISQTNGRKLEERVNFYVNRTPAVISLHSLNPFYYGLYPTIVAEVVTSKPSVVKMLYRARGTLDFSFISLDGFAINNQFVKIQHYGFIPPDKLFPETEYEVYFECQDLGGLKSYLKDGDSYFIIRTDPLPVQSDAKVQSFSLPAGQIFKDPVNFTGGSGDEVILQDNSSGSYPVGLYKFTNGSFRKIDSMKLKYPKAFGDFNADGKYDLVSSLSRTGFIEEQSAPGQTELSRKHTDSSNAFFPVLIEDLEGDGYYEILSIFHDKSLAFWSLDKSLNVKIRDTLKNFSEEDPLNDFSNSFGFSNAALTDSDGNGDKELWMVDRDGDILSYRISSGGISYGDTIHTDFSSDLSLINSGDYNGDGIHELAVLLQSNENYSIAPFNLLIIFSMQSRQFRVLYEKYFLDPSTEFRSTFQNAGKALRFADIDSDNKSELILYSYPYSYIIKDDQQSGGKIIFYRENINSNSVFLGDLNKNGVTEIAFPTADDIQFIEFGIQKRPPVPVSLTGYSIDSARIYLQWSLSAPLFYIFRGGDGSENLILYDSVTVPHFIDSQIPGKTYKYQVQAVDPSFTDRYSERSAPISVFHHIPAGIARVETPGANSVLVYFNFRMANTIEDLQSFYINNREYPISISLASQNSFMLSFEKLRPGENRLYITGLKDYYGSPVSSDSVMFYVTEIPEMNEFYIKSFSLLTPHKIEVTFNLIPESSSALNVMNYSIEPANEISGIEVNKDDLSKVTITTLRPMGSVGREYKLSIANVKSETGTGSLPLKKGAGSVIVITGTASDLNDVYVYPNPVKIQEGSGITFANVTPRCEVIIFDISGNRIRSLKEKSLNGGIDWDLKDENSRFINSGIYIYRIVSLDEYDNEIQEKLGKIAVIR